MTENPSVIPVGQIAQGGTNVPVAPAGLATFSPAPAEGASRYKAPLGNDLSLEALLVNQAGRLLVVTFHGATAREKYQLPRFEWLRTLTRAGYSSLYFADPALQLADDLSLAWYTGWRDLDLYPVLADWSLRAMEIIQAEKLLFVGTSGGGFAAMQVAARVPGSVAVAMNPQTRIARYFTGGGVGAQRRYVTHVMPHLAPEGFAALDPEQDWSAPLGARASLLKRYKNPVLSDVIYIQNINDDAHMRDHYIPFRTSVEHGPNERLIEFLEYEGPAGHSTQSQVFLNGLKRGAAKALA